MPAEAAMRWFTERVTIDDGVPRFDPLWPDIDLVCRKKIYGGVWGRFRCPCDRLARRTATEIDFDKYDTVPLEDDRRHAHATGVSISQRHVHHNEDTCRDPSLCCRKLAPENVIEPLISWRCAVEPARRDLHRTAIGAGGGTWNKPAIDSRIFVQACRRTRDGHAPSSLRRTFCME